MARMQWWTPTRAKPSLGDGEPAPLLAEQICDRDPDVVEPYLRVPATVLVTEDGRLPFDMHSGTVHRDQHHRLATVRIGVGVGEPHHDGHLATTRGGARAEPFPTGDPILVTFANDAGADVGGIRAGDIGLGHREAGSNLAIQQWRQPGRFLLGGAELVEDLHVPRVWRRAVDGLGCDLWAPPRDLGKRGVVENGQIGPELGIGEK